MIDQQGDFHEWNALIYGPSHSTTSTAHTQTTHTYNHTGSSGGGGGQDQSAISSSYDSLPQVLIHLARDWGQYGVDIRNKLYIDGILYELMKELPIGDGHNSDLKVLVPGAGLGRLAVEIAAKGYRYV